MKDQRSHKRHAPHLCPPQGDAYDAFISVAEKSEDATFVQTTKKDVAKTAGLSSAGVVVVTNFEGEFGPSIACMGRTICLDTVL